ncbi:ABC transporter substrate-binding protein [[Clostridium] dakarense]|uniref:ABC transporter substrate-binding protein n=1 Tax=Faecalimicrobium dakarense TaxID=1301100 RepID=UPI0004AD52F6|nr:ABC transporter substrate-binding protein [[Clostridium] dakarense]
MFLKRKISVLATIALVSSSLLVGCSSSKGGGEASSEEVLANKNARNAIAMAIDKQALCDVILNNGSTPSNTFTSSNLAFDNGKDYAELTKDMGMAYDEDKAKEAWKKAKEEVGFDTVTLELLTFDHDSGKRTGEFVQGELSDALEGLTVEVKNLPFKQKLAEETAGNFDLAYSGWGADYPDPLTFLVTMQSGNQFSKQVGYNSDEFNKLVDEATKADSTTDAYKKYAEAEKLMLEDGFLAPIQQKGRTYLEKPYVSGIINYSWGPDYDYRHADVDKPEKVLNIDITSDIPTMDPSKATDVSSFTVMNNTMEGLTRIDKDGKVEPGVAESWEVSEDGLTWTFKLRKDSKWSNGEPVTAKDFEYSWKRTLNPETASEYGYIMNDIAGAPEATDKGSEGVGVKAVDDHTLEVKLNRKVSYFPELVSFQVFYPQNQKFVEAQGEKYGTTAETQLYNGPFTLTSWKVEDQYTMTKNPGYWNKNIIKLDTINTKVVKETSASVNLYEDGQIDRCLLDSDYVDKYKDSKEIHNYGQASTFFLQVNGGRGASK